MNISQLKTKKQTLTDKVQQLQDRLSDLNIELSAVNAEISRLEALPKSNEEVSKELILPCGLHHQHVIRYLNSNREATIWTDRANAIVSLVAFMYKGNLPTSIMAEVALKALKLDINNLNIPKDVEPVYSLETIKNQFSKLKLTISKDGTTGYTEEMRSVLRAMVNGSYPNIPRTLFDIAVVKMPNKSVSAICQQLYNTRLLIKSYDYIAANQADLNNLLTRATTTK